MADRYLAPDGDNGDAGDALNPWLTAIYGFTNVEPQNSLICSTATYDIDRSSVYTPIPNGLSGSPTIITDAGDGAVTLRRASGWSGILYFSESGTAHKYITFQGTATNQLVFDGQSASGMSIIYLGNDSEGNGDFSFINCEIKNSAATAVLAGQSARPIFRGCHVHDNGTTGTQNHALYLGGNTDGLVENCVIYNQSGANGIRHGAVRRSGLIIRNNRVYNCGIGGVDGNGIVVYDSDNAQIYNNVCFSNAQAGIHIPNRYGTTVYHNSCYDNKYGILVGGFSTPVNVTIKNNLCLGNSDDDLHITSAATSTSYDWNVFGSAGITDNGTSSTNGGNNITTGVATDEWVDPTNGTDASKDFSLKAGSKGIWDASTNNVPSVGVTVDIEGTSRVHPDQGAYAFGTPDPPDPPVIGHTTSYLVTAGVEKAIALTLFDNDSNTLTFEIVSTGNTALRLGTTTNCTVDVVS